MVNLRSWSARARLFLRRSHSRSGGHAPHSLTASPQHCRGTRGAQASQDHPHRHPSPVLAALAPPPPLCKARCNPAPPNRPGAWVSSQSLVTWLRAGRSPASPCASSRQASRTIRIANPLRSKTCFSSSTASLTAWLRHFTTRLCMCRTRTGTTASPKSALFLPANARSRRRLWWRSS